ncbi:MAG: YfhO family protein [Candidatus Omnitrophica bacterium]|nr:YfhO family protein [Candidatus Omnitrophota bacterium]
MHFLKKYHPILLIFIILIFLFPLVTLEKSFLGGDNFVQFYPWFSAYSESIKNLQFPFWTPYIQSGFPLMAEGQVGGFYPLNIVLFFLLPFQIAYNYSIIIHFSLAALFMYFYMRRLRIGANGALFGSLIFCCGSAFAGCFYNMITLRTLAWFPLVLLLLEKYAESNRKKYLIGGSLIFGMQLLAGFVQMALYSGLFYGLYHIVRSRQDKKSWAKIGLNLFVLAFLALILYIPQFILSWDFVRQSVRAHNVSLGFALWGSFSPLGFFGMVFPSATRLIRGEFYVGIIGFIFAVFAIFYIKDTKEKRFTPLFAMLIAALLLALGKYNPFYTLLVKIFKLYSFRNPAKFLFFGLFSLSVFSGLGYSFLNDPLRYFTKKTADFLLKLFASAVFLFFIFKLILHVFKAPLLKSGYWYVERFIASQPYHRYSLEFYMHKVQAIYTAFSLSLSISSKGIIFSFLLILAGMLFCHWCIVKPGRIRKLKAIWFTIAICDLFLYGYYISGFGKNIISFNVLEPQYRNIYSIIKSDRDSFRIYPFNLYSRQLPNWCLPNANMLYKLESIASYTPLIDYNYWLKTKGLGVIDDSLGFLPAKKDVFTSGAGLLKALNVKYVITSDKLDNDKLELVAEEGIMRLYKLKNYYPRFFFSENFENPTPSVRITSKLVRSGVTSSEFEINSDIAGYFIWSQSYSEQWAVYVDEKKSRVFKPYGILQAVFLPPGEHRIKFVFYPLTSVCK